MDTLFLDSKNSKAFDAHRILLNLTDKVYLKGSDKYVTLSNLNIYYIWKYIVNYHPTWYEEFGLPDGWYSVSYIQDYFKYILEKLGENTDNHSIMIYINKIGNTVTLNIKTGYYLKLLMPGAMKLLGNSKSKITKDEYGKNLPHLEIN